uniref:Uncharacterized protein n=1 Tax=Rhizophora mucronata TaxID=61149 RepID=A0A2P2P1Y0_RHIMU
MGARGKYNIYYPVRVITVITNVLMSTAPCSPALYHDIHSPIPNMSNFEQNASGTRDHRAVNSSIFISFFFQGRALHA